MLTSIHLENFKSWQELEIQLAPITLLFGTNNSRKFSVLQALLMLKQTVNSFDRSQRLNFGSDDHD
ncbi:MAG: AAA family ATPase [Anaerolineae bacterium]|nr:AAA family ATPase [Anaerolineae bacterium]